MQITASLEGPVATRCFTEADQQAFAALSGDTNPMHMDALAARRTQAGEPVVHGIHALLWTLESLAAAGFALQTLRHLKVEFAKFMCLGRSLTVHLRRSDDTSARVVVLADGLLAMSVALRFGPRTSVPAPQRPAAVEAMTTPAVLQIEQAAGRAGWLSPPVASDFFAQAFPLSSAALHPRRLSGLAQTSRLVGMVCPGLHSIFAGLAVDLTEGVGVSDGIAFRTTKVDDEFRLVEMAVEGNGLAGRVTSFVRHAPVEAPGMDEVARHVRPHEFAGTTALVAGGSRGLGAITAKLIAAGGGRVVITYARGREDAQRLCDEINAASGRDACTTLSFDAMQPAAAQLAAVDTAVSHLYYFATPQIFVQKSELFTPSLFSGFTRVYVDAFYETCRALLRERLSVLYPSSILVEQRPKGMTEYGVAKSAGEMLCADMVQYMPGLRILVSRLPRILTDQTATLAYAESADALTVMLPLIRATHEGLSRAPPEPSAATAKHRLV